MLENTKFEHLREKIIAEFIDEEAIFTVVGKECRLIITIFCYYFLLFDSMKFLDGLLLYGRI